MPIPYTTYDDENDADIVRVSPDSYSPIAKSKSQSISHNPQVRTRNDESDTGTGTDTTPRRPGPNTSTATNAKQRQSQTRTQQQQRESIKALNQALLDSYNDNADMSAQEQARKDVQAALDEATRRIREQSDRFQKAAMPVAYRVRDFADTHPILFTFLAIFAVLSVIPTLCFIGFVLTVTAFILGTAAVLICLSMLTTFLIGASILLPVLAFTTFASGAVLVFLLFLFLCHRLYVHLSQSTRSVTGELVIDSERVTNGLKSWFDETRNRVDVGSIPTVSVPPQLRFGFGSRRADTSSAHIDHIDTNDDAGADDTPLAGEKIRSVIDGRGQPVRSEAATPIAKIKADKATDTGAGPGSLISSHESSGNSSWVKAEKLESDGSSDPPSDWSETNPIPAGPG